MVEQSGSNRREHLNTIIPNDLEEDGKVNTDKLLNHLNKDRYDDFLFTQAIRPSLDLTVLPQQGYRRDYFHAEGTKVPLLAASVSAERLFETFLDLLEPLGEVVDVVLETSHDLDGGKHRDLHREDIDLPVLMSYFYEHEDLLMNDGCTGVAVMSASKPMEIQFDEHKLLIIYAKNLRPFERILRRAGVQRKSDLKLITEAEHLHSTDDRHQDSFEQLCCRLGVGEPAEWVR